MNTKYLLAIALAAASVVAACSDAGDGTGLIGRGNEDPTPNPRPSAPGNTGDNGGGTTTPGDVGSGTAPTNSAKGKEFFSKEVFVFLDAKCSACHVGGGIGNPSFVVKADAAKTYELVYANGFAIEQSRIVLKGAHSSGAAPALLPDEATKFAQWIALEKADGGTKSQANVLEKFGTCFDKTKFDAIGLQNLRTTQRQNNNNTNNVTPWNENANNCTGCNQAPCRTCHSADPATNFVNAIGNVQLPANWTFDETQKVEYLRQYVSTGPDGKPIASDGLLKKSEATKKDRAYTHPMYTIPADVKTKLDDFVQDAITKYNAGTCGK